MFDRIAGRYDTLNRVLSLGIDRRWRKRTVEALALGHDAIVADIATGTADLAIDITRRHEDAKVIGIDPSRGMLAVAERKARRKNLDARIELHVGVAEELPLEDDSVDASCIAFGIRNVPDRIAGLAEMARVTRPGGRVAILELSEPRRGLLGPFARFHVRQVVPRIGGLLSGSREYRYLQRSIAQFPEPEEFAELMETAGLRVLSVQSLTFGACHLYVGTPENR
jgi:demethylmenaquinone methyltransferase/2-methoxy-6-polyprenyl-1,4-benzoquinol methylase